MALYRDLYKERNHIEISLIQVLSVVVVVLMSYVLPMQYFARQQAQHSGANTVPYTAVALSNRKPVVANAAEGSVAGAIDENRNLFRIPLTSVYINLNSEAGLLTIGGAGLLVFGLGIIIYLVITSPSPKEFSNIE